MHIPPVQVNLGPRLPIHPLPGAYTSPLPTPTDLLRGPAWRVGAYRARDARTGACARTRARAPARPHGCARACAHVLPPLGSVHITTRGLGSGVSRVCTLTPFSVTSRVGRHSHYTATAV